MKAKGQVYMEEEIKDQSTENTQKNVWKAVAITAILLLAVVCVLFAVMLANKDTNEPAKENKAASGDPLSLWTQGSTSKQALISYINAITDKNNADYIPPEDRIAVFDMDGTLCCETDPIYFDHMLFMHRVTEDPNYQAGEFELEVADRIRDYIATGKYPAGMDNDHGQGVASAFAGMTLKEFDAYVKAYRDTPAEGYEGMTKGDAFYKPMLQVIDYLQANDFRVYIVSGTDRLIVRGYAEGKVNIPLSQMIGSDESLVATHQGEKDGLEYTYVGEDDLVLGGDFMIKNLKMNKVTVIMQEIGQQPVLSFGNSTGDSSMAEFTCDENRYRSLAFMLCCDDTERENGNVEKAEKMVKLCADEGWIAVSMKNDWTTIYGDGVTRKK